MDSNPALGPGVVKQVRLPADPDGILARLVGGVRLLAGAPLPRWAVVGGVAVMVHLAEAHRATRDVDAVADNDTGVLRAPWPWSLRIRPPTRPRTPWYWPTGPRST